MELEKTKQILKRYIKQNSRYLETAKSDIKPDYSERGVGMKPGEGHTYSGLENFERDFIYNSILELEYIVNNRESAVQFNIEDIFITEKRAVNELIQTKQLVEKKYIKLNEINEKYSKSEQFFYPLDVCINCYREINEILDEIFNSLEFKKFLEPDLISKITNEKNELKFESYWRKRRWKYILHLLAFIPFLLGVCFVLIFKDSNIINEISKIMLIVISGTIMILFNLFFNNHSSFKNSFKLLNKNSRKELIENERDKFMKKTFANTVY